MRPLTEEELKTFFEKLAIYIGPNIKYLVDRPDEPHSFRFHKDRVYYVSENIILKASNISQDNLLSIGTCFGKFTKTKKFHLQITCLDYLAQYAEHKIWIKPNGEMTFLYGNNVLKAHVGRISEKTEKHQGVVMYSMSDVPLGFGVSARSAEEIKTLEPTAVVAFHQSDVGEYLRQENTLT